jgi:hypothetical protein
VRVRRAPALHVRTAAAKVRVRRAPALHVRTAGVRAQARRVRFHRAPAVRVHTAAPRVRVRRAPALRVHTAAARERVRRAPALRVRTAAARARARHAPAVPVRTVAAKALVRRARADRAPTDRPASAGSHRAPPGEKVAPGRRRVAAASRVKRRARLGAVPHAGLPPDVRLVVRPAVDPGAGLRPGPVADLQIVDTSNSPRYAYRAFVARVPPRGTRGVRERFVRCAAVTHFPRITQPSGLAGPHVRDDGTILFPWRFEPRAASLPRSAPPGRTHDRTSRSPRPRSARLLGSAG